ncbi:unnamed protein product [Ranitomeya imitator]|uniref:Uncharacterized protein n=1 Tax=Ranitomeya imitator TaxID=111125 RepID=A0ABN9KYU7_9NEOB|nr:unnamed protein product [Ranitomeya imitator]
MTSRLVIGRVSGHMGVTWPITSRDIIEGSRLQPGCVRGSEDRRPHGRPHTGVGSGFHETRLCQKSATSESGRHVEKVMPEDTFYFTILRNPISQMESSFSYYKGYGDFKKAKNLEDFLNNSKIFYTNTDRLTNLAKNYMTFDLGFELNGSPEQSVLTWHAMDHIFDLVLITEYYDESLILLKDALCWSFYDVLSIPLNSRSNNSKKTLTLETQEKIKSWNNLDWDMYVYFNHSFWNRVQTFGVERMEDEVKELQKIRTLMSEKCLEDEVLNPKK